MKLQKVLSSTRRFLKRNGSTILTVVGVCGGVYATVKAVKDTPKALKLLENAKKSEDYGAMDNYAEENEQTTWEKVKTVAPVYIFPAAIGLASIACIFGANLLSRKQQASLVSAYALLDQSFKEYRNAAKRVYGEDADEMIRRDVMVAEYAKMTKLPSGDLVLFYEPVSHRYFYSTSQAVTEAENDLNRNLILFGYADLNEFYDFLGVPKTMEGDVLGWSYGIGCDCADQWIDFEHQEQHMEDGEVCYVIVTPSQPDVIFTNDYSDDETDQYDRVPQIKQSV